MLLPLIQLLAVSFSTAALSLCPGGIPIDEIESFLNEHNALRQSIASGKFVAKDKRMFPSKDSIPNLTWNCDLEHSAQIQANRCQYLHSTDLDLLGENVYMRWAGTKSSMAKAIQISIKGTGNDSSKFWANEFQDYGWKDIKFSRHVFKSGVGDATQMAWQKTTQIGCGIALCNEQTSVLVVCQYKAAGNYEDEFVYLPKL